MKKWKVLNLYAGIGGNRKSWNDVEVDAVENNESIAKIYQDFFPDDNIIITDAHEYLLEHLNNSYDFIWSSPPCATHSDMRRMGSQAGMYKPKYPDMKLYEEIILLMNFSDGCKWVVENVKSYYEPLIKPQESGRHYFWSNFNITNIKIKPLNIRKIGGGTNRKARNCVEPKLGKHILDCARKKVQIELKIW